MPWTTAYLFFLFVIIINKLFYEVSLRKPILSFMVISVLFFIYFYFHSLDYSGGGNFQWYSLAKNWLKLIHDNLVAYYRVAIFGLLSLWLFKKALFENPFVSCFCKYDILCVDRFSDYDVIDLALVLLSRFPWISYWSGCSCCFSMG